MITVTCNFRNEIINEVPCGLEIKATYTSPEHTICLATYHVTSLALSLLDGWVLLGLIAEEIDIVFKTKVGCH